MDDKELLKERSVVQTIDQIKHILCNVKAERYDDNWDDVADEVYPGIFIGDSYCAKNKKILEKIGITHVLNAAQGKGIGLVNTSSDYYKDNNIKYLGIELSDLSVSDAARYFQVASEFIDSALTSKGRILVHCLMGVSRSATFVIAYLMLKKQMSATEAVCSIRKRRNIHPNEGFIKQLALLEYKTNTKCQQSNP